jgi:hypothetical protein
VSAAEPSARNGILGCGDRGPEIAARDNIGSQRPEGAEIDVGNRGTKGLSELDRKKPGSAGLAGGGCSPAKLVSKFNNREFFEDFRSKQASGEKKGAARSKFDSFRR